MVDPGLGDCGPDNRANFEEALKLKSQATEKFKEGDYFSAKCLYAGALELVEGCRQDSNQGNDTWEGIKNNMALCDVKRQEWTRVIETTTEILARNPLNSKALYRRATALVAQEKYADAQRDLRLVVDMNPEDPDALRKLAEVGQLIKAQRNAEREQAGKMKGFLHGERLESGVAVGQDGGVRKLRGNDAEQLVPRWLKRAWLSPDSGTTALLQAHVVMKEAGGKEIFSTRRAVAAARKQAGGSAAHATPRPAAPIRWVLDDVTGGVFAGWNSAARCMQLGELARFEVAQRTLAPSVEFAIEWFVSRWLGDNAARREQLEAMPEELRESSLRRQALQILGLPEELCMNKDQVDPDATMSMEMELVEAQEFEDLEGDGRTLLRVLRSGKRRSAGCPDAAELCTVRAHYRVSKLLIDHTLTDTRSGIMHTGDGIALSEDRSKEAKEFILGEEDAADFEDSVPPCIGRCLRAFPGGATEGAQFEMVLRDGVPASDLDRRLKDALDTGAMSRDLLPDTTGAVIIRIELESVVLPSSGPTDPGWKGLESLQRERERAQFLEAMDGGKHWQKALRRWRRVLLWLERLLQSRRWKLQHASAAEAASTTPEAAGMYDFDWGEEEGGCDNEGAGAPGAGQEQLKLWSPEDLLLKELDTEELLIWAEAHAASAHLLAAPPWRAGGQQSAITGGASPPAPQPAGDGEMDTVERHTRCAIQAAQLVRVPAPVQVRARSVLGERLLSRGKAGEALEVLRTAQAMDPSNTSLRDQVAKAVQRDSDQKADDTKDALRLLKRELAQGLESGTVGDMLALLMHVDGLPLTWDAVSATGIGKEIGRCSKHDDETVAARAKALVAKFHRLAKTERPMWVR